jgi:uncharacterized protein YraI
MILAGSVLGGLLLAAPALAAPVYSSVDLNLRTGPGEEYPVLGVLKKNDEGDALGCVADWSWCDVSFGGFHGWVAAEYLVTQPHHLFSNPGESVAELQAASLIPIVEPVIVVVP